MVLKAILLEPDGTLYPYGPCHAAGMAAAHRLSAFSRDAFQTAYVDARQKVKSRLGPEARSRILYFQALVEEIEGSFDAERVLAYYNAYWGAYLAAMKPIPEASDALSRLPALGIKLALVSNVPVELQLRQVQALGLPVDTVATADEAGGLLPEPQPIDLALDKLQLTADDVWVVGLKHQALVDAAEFEQLFTVYLDADQAGRINARAFGVVGWAGFDRLLDKLAGQG